MSLRNGFGTTHDVILYSSYKSVIVPRLLHFSRILLSMSSFSSPFDSLADELVSLSSGRLAARSTFAYRLNEVHRLPMATRDLARLHGLGLDFDPLIEITDLPVEILQIIFEHFTPFEAANARLSCKRFAQVGLDFLVRHLNVSFDSPSFEWLRDISELSTLNHTVRSLHYDADNIEEYRNDVPWEEQIEVLDLLGWFDGEAIQDPLYKDFFAYLNNQWAIRAAERNVNHLARAMVRLPNLREISMWSGGCLPPKSAELRAMNIEYYQLFFGDIHPVRPLGVYHLLSVLLATSIAGLKLKTFRCIGAHWQTFQQTDEKFTILKGTIRHLRTLELMVDVAVACAENETGRYWFEPGNRSSWVAFFPEGRFLEFVSAAPTLKTLSIKFNCNEPSFAVALKDVVGDFTWESLVRVSIGMVAAQAEDMVGFFERHARTLRCVSLEDIRLTAGRWSFVFEKMAALLKLDEIILLGYFDTDGISTVSSMGPLGSSDFTQDLKDYILRGENVPIFDLKKAYKPHAERIMLEFLEMLET